MLCPHKLAALVSSLPPHARTQYKWTLIHAPSLPLSSARTPPVLLPLSCIDTPSHSWHAPLPLPCALEHCTTVLQCAAYVPCRHLQRTHKCCDHTPASPTAPSAMPFLLLVRVPAIKFNTVLVVFEQHTVGVGARTCKVEHNALQESAGAVRLSQVSKPPCKLRVFTIIPAMSPTLASDILLTLPARLLPYLLNVSSPSLHALPHHCIQIYASRPPVP